MFTRVGPELIVPLLPPLHGDSVTNAAVLVFSTEGCDKCNAQQWAEEQEQVKWKSYKSSFGI